MRARILTVFIFLSYLYSYPVPNTGREQTHIYTWNGCISALLLIRICALEQVTSLLGISFTWTVKWEYTFLPKRVFLKFKREKIWQSVRYKTLCRDKKTAVFFQSRMFKDVVNQTNPLPAIYKFPNILAPRVLHGACLSLPVFGIPESQRILPHHDNQEGWAGPRRSPAPRVRELPGFAQAPWLAVG